MSEMLWDVRSAFEPVLRRPAVIVITALAVVLGVGATSEMVTAVDAAVRHECMASESARLARVVRVLDKNDVCADIAAPPSDADDLRME